MSEQEPSSIVINAINDLRLKTIETQLGAVQELLAEINSKMTGQALVEADVERAKKDLEAAFREIRVLKDRQASIEIRLPTLELISSWVQKGVLSVVFMNLAAIAAALTLIWRLKGG